MATAPTRLLEPFFGPLPRPLCDLVWPSVGGGGGVIGSIIRSGAPGRDPDVEEPKRFNLISDVLTVVVSHIQENHTNRPHSALPGATPDEVYRQIQATSGPGLAPNRANPERRLTAYSESESTLAKPQYCPNNQLHLNGSIRKRTHRRPLSGGKRKLSEVPVARDEGVV